jgi:AcrR family transcriptional regulator
MKQPSCKRKLVRSVVDGPGHSHKTPKRRTQDERSAEMRGRLVRATVKCLIAYGYERTTTLRIVAQAGVTRGALAHHFESKRHLVVSAMHSLLENHAKRIQSVAEQIRVGKVGLNEFIDYLWKDYAGDFFFAWLENITESRHDHELREQLIPLVREYHGALDTIWRAFFKKSYISDSQVDTSLNQTLCLLRGMGLQTVLRPDPHYYQALLSSWKATLRRLIEVKTDEQLLESNKDARRTRARYAAHRKS